MINFILSEKDKRYIYLKPDTDLDNKILKENMMSIFNLIDPISYLPTYKGDPIEHKFLFEYIQKNKSSVYYAPIGMWYPIWKYLRDNGIEYNGLDKNYFKLPIKHTFDEFKDIVNSWGLSRNPRPYQYEAAYKVLQYKNSLSELATRAGKTLIAYMVFRYSMEYLGVKKILMIVPSIELVKQGYNDFKEYAEFFKTECIWGGGKIVESSNLTIGTFNSLVNLLDNKNKKYNPDFYNNFDMVFVDETHRAASPSIKKIITHPFINNVKLIFGMTGTLPKEYTIESYSLHSLLGPKIQTIKANELIQQNYISPIRIIQHQLIYKNYDKQINNWIKCAEYSLSNFVEHTSPTNPKKKIRVKLDNPNFLLAYEKEFPIALKQAKDIIYSDNNIHDANIKYKELLTKYINGTPKANMLHTEVMMVHFFDERIDYLNMLLYECPKNTLILAQHTEYIKYIVEKIKQVHPDRPVIGVYGTSKERKIAKTTFIENDNAIMVANYAIMGTGITLNNLCYGVLFESFKSDALNRQSIGRGLGLSEMKKEYVLHDITDVFSAKYASQKILKQGEQRQKIYEEQKFPYTIEKHIIK